MSDTSGPRYTINSLPDFRFELRRNGMVMGYYGSWDQAQLASQQIDLEVAQSTPQAQGDIETCSLTDAQLLDTSIVARADHPVEFETIRAAFRELYDRRVASAAGEGLEPVDLLTQFYAIRIGKAPLPISRDELGREVRTAWVRWAEQQASPKPHWLTPYDDLSEADKEADRQIGLWMANVVLDKFLELNPPSDTRTCLVDTPAARAAVLPNGDPLDKVDIAARAIYDNGPGIGGDTENGWDAQSDNYKFRCRAIAHVVIAAALKEKT